VIAQDAEEQAMKKMVVPLGRILFVLLLMAGLSVCTMSDRSESPPPEDALSFDQLLANLDELQGPATQSPSTPGKSVFGLPDGSLLGSADLSAYINAIKRDLAAYIYSCTGGAPYLVTATKVPLTGSTSGLVWVPFTWGWPKKFPIISYQHGTQVYRYCAPSRFNANPLAILGSPDLTGALQNYVECIVGGLMASAGYIVVMPDYQGFGDSTVPHPYVHLSLGASVKDMVTWAKGYFTWPRAARAGSAVYLTGYSEGGYATMAGALALNAVGVSPTMVVPCDGAYDLSGTMLSVMLDDKIDPVPSYLLYTAAGYKAAKTGVVYSSFLELKYEDILTDQHPFDGDHTNAYVDNLDLPAYAGDMVLGWPYSTPADRPDALKPGGAVYDLLLANNSWNGWGTLVKPVFVHCPVDDVVPYANAYVAAAMLGMHPETNPDAIREVAPIPLVAQLMGSIHVGAYPTAMVEAFKIIRGN
jgi:pimeloyl-ACP methyl ester carboxylesterase